MLHLYRVVSTARLTRGVIVYNDTTICHTLELPWINNKPNHSCIPDGLYNLTRINHTKFGTCYRFAHVPDRSGILIHAGNSVIDSRGCLLVGLDTSDNYILQSKQALARLHALLPDNFNLRISNKGEPHTWIG